MWISEENKYLSKSLRTTDWKEALEKAEELYIELRNNIREGRKATKISLATLIQRYLIYQRKSGYKIPYKIGSASYHSQ